MPLQDLTVPPTAPQRSDDPELFIQRADAFVAWFATFVGQMNTLSAQLETAASLLAIAPAYADPGLVALTGQTIAADRLPYFTGPSSSSLAIVTAAARTFLTGANAADQRSALGLGTAALQATTAFDAAGVGTSAASSALAAHVAAGDPHAQYLLESALAIAGDGTSGKLTLGSFVLSWRDHTVASNTTTSCAYGAGHTYASWARGWFNGGTAELATIDNYPFVASAGLTAADVLNSFGDPVSGTLFAMGV